MQQTSNNAKWMKDRMGEVRTILFKHRSYRLQALTCLLSLKKMIEQVPALVNVITETTHSYFSSTNCTSPHLTSPYFSTSFTPHRPPKRPPSQALLVCIGQLNTSDPMPADKNQYQLDKVNCANSPFCCFSSQP